MSKSRGFRFSAFGKSRQTIINPNDIISSIDKLPPMSLQCLETESVYPASSSWSFVCKDLGIPNVKSNRIRIKNAYIRHKQSQPVRQLVQTTPVLHTEKDQGEVLPTADLSPESVCAGTTPCKDVTDENNNTTSGSTTSAENDSDDKYFIHKLREDKQFFFIKREEWMALRRTQEKRQFKTLQWTNVIAKGIRSIQPFCCFSFKRHSVQSLGSQRKTPLFLCSGRCTFNGCPITVKVVIEDETTLKADVYFQGDTVRHSNEQLKQRPIRADERHTIAESLQSKHPRTLYLENLQKLEDTVLNSGCRDDAPTPAVLKTLSWSERKKQRKHKNDMSSLLIMSQEEQDTQDSLIQKLILKPKGVMLWSQKTIQLFKTISKEDVVYLDATGSVVKKGEDEKSPFYIYELVVRHPIKGCSPVPVATYVTCDHTTASVSHFLGSFATDCVKFHGRNIMKRPVMYICDGSLVLMQSISFNFCGLSLHELLCQYFHIVKGQAKESSLALPILHRCLSHIMKNAKDLCKKHASKHYRLAMHTFGLMTRMTTLQDLDEAVLSAAVLFGSAHSGRSVEKHFQNIQALLTATKQSDMDDTAVTEEDFVNDLGPTPFQDHFGKVISQAKLDTAGPPNTYHCQNFMPKLLKYFLPHAPLWSSLLLGDLGRHGKGRVYEKFSKRFSILSQKQTQNYTKDNKSQGTMEKSQWDLKNIRFQHKRITRLDDFVNTYKVMHAGLLREYEDNLKLKTANKTHRVDLERWKQRKQGKRGVYVSPVTKPFTFKNQKDRDWNNKPPPPSVQPTMLPEAQIEAKENVAAHSQFHKGLPGTRKSGVMQEERVPHITSSADTPAEKRLSVDLTNNVGVCVWKADITAFAVDAIVNAANVNLQHHGGLALALSKAGGAVIQTESNMYIAKYGKLQTGDAILASPGSLPCKHVIHAVGPCLTPHPTPAAMSEAKKSLSKTVCNILKIVDENGLQSVAIPSISSGIFNFPKTDCADIIVSSVKTFHDQTNSLRQALIIHLVNNDEMSVKEMERACQTILLSKGRNSGPDVSLTSQHEQLTSLWRRKDTEVVVSVIPSQIRGNNFAIHHSEFNSLRPHEWLTGEVIEGLLHLASSQFNVERTIYILNHYTAGVILFGKRSQLRRHALKKLSFENYKAILSFVNTNRVHWKLLYICPAASSVFLVDPAPMSTERADSEYAAKRVREYFNMRRTLHGKMDWGRIRWKGGLMEHPVQTDTSSCGVIVTMMARAVMQAFPTLPVMAFGTSKEEMAQERRELALSILTSSVFDMDNNCAMCCASKPPGTGPPTTNWIQCDSCERWFHEQCLDADKEKLEEARAGIWHCLICY